MRAWAMSKDGKILATQKSDAGINTMKDGEFEQGLSDLISPWLHGPIPILLCGAVGSREGWIDAGYLDVPCKAEAGETVRPNVVDPNLNVHILPGVRQLDPADIMRGEETQIAGFLAQNGDWDGVICLPGTETKWVHISAGEIVSFQTYITGGLFSILSTHSALRHSIDGGWNDESFKHGLDQATNRPEKLAAQLFAIRADDVVKNSKGARSRLSGLLIGAEISAAKPYWLGQNVVVVGNPEISQLYVDALAYLSVDANQFDGGLASIAGLSLAFRSQISK